MGFAPSSDFSPLGAAPGPALAGGTYGGSPKVELNIACRFKFQLLDPGILVLNLFSTSKAMHARRPDIVATQLKHAKISVLQCSEAPIYQNSHAALRLLL